MVEPTACAVHAALRGRHRRRRHRRRARRGHARAAHHRRPPPLHRAPARVIAVAKHPRAARAGPAARRRRASSRPTSSPGRCAASPARMALGDGDIARLTGGADVVVDCVGSEPSLAAGPRRGRGPAARIAMVGMPGHVHVDLTGLWQREIEPRGCLRLRHRDAWRDGDRATHLRPRLRARRGGRPRPPGDAPPIPLGRYSDAIAHAANAGAAGAVRSPSTSAEKERSATRDLPDPGSSSTSIGRRRRSCSTTARVPAREAARRPHRGSSTRPSRSSRSTTPTAPSATRCSTRIGD